MSRECGGWLTPRHKCLHVWQLTLSRAALLVCCPHRLQQASVEDLVHICSTLAPGASAVAAVSGSLGCLDSRALAALMKELARAQHAARAMELFDWLRALPPDHELSCLCDVFTYTTAISLMGPTQQLRRALELVGEMRARGARCNVHTYSALMNVCIKVCGCVRKRHSCTLVNAGTSIKSSHTHTHTPRISCAATERRMRPGAGRAEPDARGWHPAQHCHVQHAGGCLRQDRAVGQGSAGPQRHARRGGARRGGCVWTDAAAVSTAAQPRAWQ